MDIQRRTSDHTGHASQRSIVFDLFGDYIRYAGGEIKLASLTALLAVFGFDPPIVRVVMSRLKNEGWFDTRRDGRQTVYALNERSYRLLDEGRTRIFHWRDGNWTGRWTMVVYQVPKTDRSTRDRIRKKLAWLGFGRLSSSTWIAPHDLFAEVEFLARTEPAATLDVLWCGTGNLQGDRELVARCWELDQLGQDYREFTARYLAMDDPKAAAEKDGKTALLERMAIISDFRKFPFRDPQLPDELQPVDWPGAQARKLFGAVHGQLAVQANAYVASIIGRPVNAPPTVM